MNALIILLMTADHLGAYFFPEVEPLRLLGRFVVPLIILTSSRSRMPSNNTLYFGIFLTLTSPLLTPSHSFHGDFVLTYALTRKLCENFRKTPYTVYPLTLALYPITLPFLDYASLLIPLLAGRNRLLALPVLLYPQLLWDYTPSTAILITIIMTPIIITMTRKRRKKSPLLSTYYIVHKGIFSWLNLIKPATL